MATCCDCTCETALCTLADPPIIRCVDGSDCVHFGLDYADTNCIDLSVNGAGELEASPIISPDSGNSLECRANGLYTPTASVSGDSCNAATLRSDGFFVQQQGAEPISNFQDYATGYVLDPGDVAVNQKYHIQSSVLTDPPLLFNGSPITAGWTTVPVSNPSDCKSAHMFYNLQTSDVYAVGLAGTSTEWKIFFRSAVFDPVTTNIIELGPGTLFNGENGDEQCLPVHDTDRIQTLVPGYSGDWAITGLMEIKQVGDAAVTFNNIGLLFMSGLVVVDF